MSTNSNNSDYLSPGLAALCLFFLFPAYWGYQFSIAESGFEAAFYANFLSFDLSDLVWLILGALEIYIYLSLKRVLLDRFNFRGVNVFLNLLIINTAIHYLFPFLIDLSILFMGNYVGDPAEHVLTKSSLFLATVQVAIYGLLGLIVGVLLLGASKQLPFLLKAFAVTTLVMGVFELTFVFAFIGLLIFPISMLILAVYFLKEPEMVEVV